VSARVERLSLSGATDPVDLVRHLLDAGGDVQVVEPLVVPSAVLLV